MGFLDFLKKEEKKETNKQALSSPNNAQAHDELSFGKPATKDIPPPPGQALNNKKTNQASVDESVDPFSNNQTNNNSDNPFMQGNDDSANDPFMNNNNNDSFEETNTSEAGVDLSQDFDPQEPDSFMTREEEDFGPVQGYDWSHAEVMNEPVHAPQTTTMPEPTTPITQEQPEKEEAPEEDYSLPELPALPAEAEEESLGAHLKQEQEETPAQTLSQKFSEQTTKEEKKTPSFTSHDNSMSDEESLGKKPEYVPEKKEKEIIPEEFFIEAHEFYDNLQEIKAFKRVTKDCDTIAVGWEKTQENNEKKMNSLIEHVDTIQEDLMKIDAIIFER